MSHDEEVDAVANMMLPMRVEPTADCNYMVTLSRTVPAPEGDLIVEDELSDFVHFLCHATVEGTNFTCENGRGDSRVASYVMFLPWRIVRIEDATSFETMFSRIRGISVSSLWPLVLNKPTASDKKNPTKVVKLASHWFFVGAPHFWIEAKMRRLGPKIVDPSAPPSHAGAMMSPGTHLDHPRLQQHIQLQEWCRLIHLYATVLFTLHTTAGGTCTAEALRTLITMQLRHAKDIESFRAVINDTMMRRFHTLIVPPEPIFVYTSPPCAFDPEYAFVPPMRNPTYSGGSTPILNHLEDHPMFSMMKYP